MHMFDAHVYINPCTFAYERKLIAREEEAGNVHLSPAKHDGDILEGFDEGHVQAPSQEPFGKACR
jgi:hypothetical protein